MQLIVETFIVTQEGMKVDNSGLVVLQCEAPTDALVAFASPILTEDVIVNPIDPELELFFCSFRVRWHFKCQGAEPVPGVSTYQLAVHLHY